MNRGLLLAVIAALWLAGCGVGKWLAPIREIGRAGKVIEYYTVQPGDTLYKIAFERGIDIRDLAAWNNLADIHRIRAGERLRMLPPRAVKSASPAAAVADKTHDKNVASAARIDGEPSAWSWPLRGKVLLAFNESAGNKGIDIAGVIGEPIVAATDGLVVYTGEGLRGYGKLTIIRHSPTILSAYAHQARISVSEGQTVKRGQKIGEVGDSDADRTKLHFEIRRFGRPIDPLTYISRPG